MLQLTSLTRHPIRDNINEWDLRYFHQNDIRLLDISLLNILGRLTGMLFEIPYFIEYYAILLRKLMKSRYHLKLIHGITTFPALQSPGLWHGSSRWFHLEAEHELSIQYLCLGLQITKPNETPCHCSFNVWPMTAATKHAWCQSAHVTHAWQHLYHWTM